MLDTGRAFFNALKAARELEISEASLKRARERRKVASSRLKVGEVTRSVLLRAEADVAGAEADLIRAQNQVDRRQGPSQKIYRFRRRYSRY